MPYIKQERRDVLMSCRVSSGPISPGELNYVLTNLVYQYWNCQGPNYTTINDIIGALEGAKMEFYRRVAVPYEDIKIKENGDVYT